MLYFLNKWLQIVDNESAIKEADSTVNQSQKELILLIPQIFFSHSFSESPPSDIGEHLFSQLYSIYERDNVVQREYYFQLFIILTCANMKQNILLTLDVWL